MYVCVYMYIHNVEMYDHMYNNMINCMYDFASILNIYYGNNRTIDLVGCIGRHNDFQYCL